MNKYLELALKGVIISSTMITTNEVVDYYDKFQAINKGGNRLACKVAANSAGFVIGRKVANDVVKVLKAAALAYKGETDGTGE